MPETDQQHSGIQVNKANRNARRAVRSAKSVAKRMTLQQNVKHTQNKEESKKRNLRTM